MNIEGRKQRDRNQVQSLGFLLHHQPQQPRHLASSAAPSPAQRTTATDHIMERRKHWSRREADPRRGGGAGWGPDAAAVTTTSLGRDGMGSTSSRLLNPRQFLLKAKHPARELCPRPPTALLTEGPVFSGGRGSTWGPAQSTQQNPHVTTLSRCLPQVALTKHASPSRLQQDSLTGAIHSFHSGYTYDYFFQESWPQLTPLYTTRALRG